MIKKIKSPAQAWKEVEAVMGEEIGPNIRMAWHLIILKYIEGIFTIEEMVEMIRQVKEVYSPEPSRKAMPEPQESISHIRESDGLECSKSSSRRMPLKTQRLYNFAKRCWGRRSCQNMRFRHGSPRNESRNKTFLLSFWTQCHSPLGMIFVKSHMEASSLTPSSYWGTASRGRGSRRDPRLWNP